MCKKICEYENDLRKTISKLFQVFSDTRNDLARLRDSFEKKEIDKEELEHTWAIRSGQLDAMAFCIEPILPYAKEWLKDEPSMSDFFRILDLFLKDRMIEIPGKPPRDTN